MTKRIDLTSRSRVWLDGEPCLTQVETAPLWGLSLNSFKNAMTAGRIRIPRVKFANLTLFRVSDVEAALSGATAGLREVIERLDASE